MAITTSGLTAKLCSKYRPHCPIVAVTRFDEVARQMQLHRGIIPILYKEPRMENWMQDVEERIQHGVDLGKKSGFIKSGQPIVCITGKEIEIIHRLFIKSVNFKSKLSFEPKNER